MFIIRNIERPSNPYSSPSEHLQSSFLENPAPTWTAYVCNNHIHMFYVNHGPLIYDCSEPADFVLGPKKSSRIDKSYL